jgi:hypothetical protein
MCAPLIVAGVAMAAAAAVKGYAEHRAAAAESRIANANADLAEQSAADARRIGATEAGQIRAKGTQVASEQKVALASSGVDVSGGTAANLFATTMSAAELDALTAKNNAARRAWGFEVEARGQRARAAMASRRSVLGPLAASLGAASAIAGLYGGGGGGAAASGSGPAMSDWFVD